MYIPDDQEWFLENTDAGYSLKLTNWAAGFDISSVFERMPQTRVNDVVATESAMGINISCACVAVAEKLPGIGLVIDVSEGASPELVVAADPTPVPVAAPISIPNRASEPAKLDLVELPENDQANAALDAFRKSLFEGLGRSASLELVDVDRFSEDVNAGAPGAASDFGGVVDNGRIRVTTAVEDAAGANRTGALQPQISQCPSPRKFEIQTWGTDEAYSTQVATLRRDILGEFDAVNDEKVQELARLYLYFGLGVEARALIAQFAITANEQEIILSLSHILEPEYSLAATTTLQLSGCGLATTPWSVLTRPAGKTVTEKEAVETTAEFLRWPGHLQEYLGPRLISALSASGRSESVEVIKNVLSRESGELPPAAKILAEEYNVSTSRSLDELLEIAYSGGDQAGPAVSLYLERALANGIQIDENLVALAGAFAEEANGSRLGNELVNLSLKALAGMGRIDEAIAEYKRARSLGWMPETGFGDSFASHVLDSGSEQQVARFAVFFPLLNAETTVSSESQSRLSQALLEMGLIELAARVYQSQPISDEPTKISAELAIASGSVESAIEILDGIGDETAQERRTNILLRAGRAQEAWSDLSSNATSDQIARLAWPAQRWSSVEPNGVEGRVAAMLNKEPSTDLENAPIASAREFSEDSELSRQAVQELLGAAGL